MALSRQGAVDPFGEVEFLPLKIETLVAYTVIVDRVPDRPLDAQRLEPRMVEVGR